MAKDPPKEEFVWVKHLGRYWMLPARLVPAGLFILGAIVSFVGWKAAENSTVAVVGVVILLSSIPTYVLNSLLIYRLIKCPHCGYNPTRNKAKGKPMSFDLVFSRLAKFECCPECGDSGSKQ